MTVEIYTVQLPDERTAPGHLTTTNNNIEQKIEKMLLHYNYNYNHTGCNYYYNHYDCYRNQSGRHYDNVNNYTNKTVLQQFI